MPGRPLTNRREPRGAAGEAALLEVLLVVVLGLPERLGVLDLRHDRPRDARLDAVTGRFRRRSLCVVMDEDRRPVLVADIRPLAVQLRRIVLGPERGEQ